ncbi:putative E3 SUMO-protein ligase RNF212 isoform X1 [Denticeps clupeoides]|uniref:putative E3 SUMO-protein ligase RNF212 isoform X1 n=1 Tax=Denticeps clupeoides TaxID=299321 RepID=UPI0010A42732|nr:probable E3 SUMO-protein ligase RNF212 isoform X1 [Denticeps clupeoides]
MLSISNVCVPALPSFSAKQSECAICKTKCQLSPLIDKSSPEVKSLFSDISAVASAYVSEINKVLLFQARHQKRLMDHYQQRYEKMEEFFLKMRQEMQQISRKVSEQAAYISKLEDTIRCERAENIDSRTQYQKDISGSISRLSLSSPFQDRRIHQPALSEYLTMTGTIVNRTNQSSAGPTAQPLTARRDFSYGMMDILKAHSPNLTYH